MRRSSFRKGALLRKVMKGRMPGRGCDAAEKVCSIFFSKRRALWAPDVALTALPVPLPANFAFSSRSEVVPPACSITVCLETSEPGVGAVGQLPGRGFRKLLDE